MTAVLPEIDEEVAEETAPPCGARMWTRQGDLSSGRDCEFVAAWRCIFRCCGYVKLLCEGL